MLKEAFAHKLTVSTAALLAFSACSSDDDSATVAIKNDFNNPKMSFQPPWTICKSSYLGAEFGKLEPGQTSDKKTVPPGLDYVLMVVAWDDPSCSPSSSLPIASTEEEEVLDGQTRTIAIGLTNHRGACPPEGIAPVPEAQYNRILSLWPEFSFKPYAQRTENEQCVE